MFLMENVNFSQEERTLEVHQVTGYLLIYSDDDQVTKVPFCHKVKIHFVIQEAQTNVTSPTPTSVPNLLATTEVKCENLQVDDLSAENEDTCCESSEEDIVSKSSDDLNLTCDTTYSMKQVTTSCSIVLKSIDGFYASNIAGSANKVPRNHQIDSKSMADHIKDIITHCELSQEKNNEESNASVIKNSKSVTEETDTSLSGFYCQLCKTWFPNAKEENKHKRNPDSQMRCGQCPAIYPCKADLFSHVYERHSFTYLKTQFSELNLQEEIQWPKDKKRITCPICHHATSFKYIKYHIATHFDDLSYKCCLCGCALKNAYSFTKHCKEHTSERSAATETPENENIFQEAMTNQNVCSVLKPYTQSTTTACKNARTSRRVKKSKTNFTKIKKKINNCDDRDLSDKTVSSELEQTQESYLDCKAEFQDHGVMDKEQKRGYQCTYCKKSFSTPKHLRFHRVTPSLNLKCHICGVALPSQAWLILHEFEVHRLPCILAEDDNAAGADDLNESQQESVNKQQRCRAKQYVACPVCSVQVTRIALPMHIMRQHTKESPFRCCVCNYPCSSMRVYKLHCDEHNGQLRRGYFHCSSCPSVFDNKSELHKHAVVHKRICHFCNIDFEHANLLDVHYNTEHYDQMMKCKHCSKRFANEHKLKEHERHHRFTTVRPCPKCGIMVKRLKVHMLRRHPEPGVEFLCSICPKKFTNKIEFNNHVRRHTDSDNGVKFTCPKCPKTFSCRGYLNDHIKVHLTRKLFDCPICGKQCTEKYNLKIHMRIHSNHKLFACDQCGQGFNYKASLIGHQKSKHKLANS